jgi:hypothetical protein
MNPLKRGVCIPREIATWIYSASRTAGVSENQVIVRMLRIAREDLGPFDDVALRRILREPWQVVEKMPAFVRRIQRRSQPRLRAMTAIRVTVAIKQALIRLATKHHTTMSGIVRQLLEGTLAKETA